MGSGYQAVAVSLRDAVAASYRLLEPEEQVALRRLSPFRNRWSVELGEADAGRPDAPGGPLDGDPVPLLDRLVALGLLSVRGAGSMRFRLLDVVRDYAEEQAAAEGELAAIRRRHALVIARFAARIAPDLAGGSLPGAVARLDDVTSDLWAALAHSAIDDPHTALLLAANLPRWWRFRGRDAAGRQWLRRLLDDPRTADADPCRAGLGAARRGPARGRARRRGRARCRPPRRRWRRFREQGDVSGELAARNQLSALWMSTGGYDEARRHGAAALALATRTGRTRDMAVAQNNLAWHEIRAGDLAAARRRLAAVDRLAAQCGEDRLRALALANLAEVDRLDGRYEDAVTMGRRAIAALERLGDPGHRARVLGTIGLALAQAGRPDEAFAVLEQLRAAAVGADPGVGEAPANDVQGPSAMIEATLAAKRADRELAAEWFGVAVQSYAGGRDLRDVAEALVGLASVTDDSATRAAVVERLERGLQRRRDHVAAGGAGRGPNTKTAGADRPPNQSAPAAFHPRSTRTSPPPDGPFGTSAPRPRGAFASSPWIVVREYRIGARAPGIRNVAFGDKRLTVLPVFLPVTPAGGSQELTGSRWSDSGSGAAPAVAHGLTASRIRRR